MRYCGNCGVQLFSGALTAGHCLSCGAPITEAVTAQEAQEIARSYQVEGTLASGDMQSAFVPLDNLDIQPTPPTQAVNVATQTQRRRLGIWALLGMAVILLLLLLLAWHAISGGKEVRAVTSDVPAPGLGATATNPSQPILGASGTPNAKGTPGNVPGGVPTPGSNTTPAPGQTPPPGTTPTIGVTATMNGQTPTPTPTVPPSIGVSQITFSQLVCVDAQINFTISNTGGGSLNWQATTSNALYQIQPTSGSLSAGQSTTVTVTQITTSGTITITAPGASNSQTITISCKVP